jgi:PAS domain S-box-containing protein
MTPGADPEPAADEATLTVDAVRWRAILRTARDAIVCIDRGGRIAVFNPAAEQMFGYAHAEILGEPLQMLMTAPDRERHDEYVRDYERTRVPKAIGRIRRLQARRKSGEVFPIELSLSEAHLGDETLYSAIIRDATEQMRAEAIIASRIRQQAVVADLGLRALAGVPLPALMSDAARLVAETLDVTYCEILELLPDGSALRLVAGVGWADGLVGHALVPAGPDSQAGYTLARREPVRVEDLRTEHRFATPELLATHGIVSGTSVVIHGRREPYGVLGAHCSAPRHFDPDDTHFLQGVANVLATAIERRTADEEAHGLRELARQRAHLADLGAIAAQVVHDIGNPAAALSLQAELLLRRAGRDDPPSRDAISTAVGRIVGEVRRLDKIVNDFKDFARQQRLDRTVIDVRRLIEDVAALWRPVAHQQAIALDVDVPGNVPSISADEGKLRRVLDNLLKNAVEAMNGAAGRIHIQVCEPAPGKLRISVRDSGVGIRPDLQVFRLFETTKPGGTGLGLAVAKQIAIAHGGDLGVERLDPNGTIFHLDVPLEAPGRP